MQQPGTENLPVDTTFLDAIDWVLVAFVGVIVVILAVSAFMHRGRVAAMMASRGPSRSTAAEGDLARRLAAVLEAERDVKPRPRDPARIAALLEINARANRMLPSNLEEFVAAASRREDPAVQDAPDGGSDLELAGGADAPAGHPSH